MPSRFVLPDPPLLVSLCDQFAEQLPQYNGEPITPAHSIWHPAYWLGVYSIETNSTAIPHRMVRPLNRLWRATVLCSTAGMLCYRPSKWPSLVQTGSLAATPKLARDWRDILLVHIGAFARLVAFGQYEKIVVTNAAPTAEQMITDWIGTLIEASDALKQH